MNNAEEILALPPGEHIREELKDRGWTQADLARILNRPLPAVNQIINGKRAISPETAKELAAAFGTSAEVWMNLDARYRLAKATAPTEEIQRRVQAFDKALAKHHPSS